MIDHGELRGALAATALFLAVMLLLLRSAIASTVLRRITQHWRVQRTAHAFGYLAGMVLLAYILVSY